MAPPLRTALVFGSLLAHAAKPSVKVFPNTRNLRTQGFDSLTWPPPAPVNHTVKLLPAGNASAADCEAACFSYWNTEASNATGWSHCQAFTFDPEGSPSAPCIAVVDPWDPFDPEGGAPDSTVTGVVTWPPAPCSVDSDCSGNGECSSPAGSHQREVYYLYYTILCIVEREGG